MEQRSGKTPGGDGRVRSVFGVNAIGNRMIGDSAIENSMRDNNGVGDSGGGNASMQTLQQLMATILRDAWPGDGAAAGSGNVIRDDVWEEQLVGRLARGRTSKLAEQ